MAQTSRQNGPTNREWSDQQHAQRPRLRHGPPSRRHPAHRRTREIAVRKILGAGVFRILQLLLWQTSKPVLFASLIAGPVAVYFMRREWLSQYRYHFDIAAFGIAICLSAVLLALVLSWVTVGGHAAKAARSRPIEALRHE